MIWRFDVVLRSLLSNDRLSGRVLRGGIWLIAATILTRVAAVAKLAVLGHLLAPTDFGMMGLAIVILRWLEYFTETGFGNALVRQPGPIEPYLDTAWTVQIVRGACVAATLAIVAPIAATFFGQPDAVWIIRAIGLTTLLRGFMNPAVVHLRREMNFRLLVTTDIAGALTGVLSALAIAVAYRSVWALVVSTITAQTASTIASYIVKPYHPRFRINRAKARELTNFGKWIFCSNVVAFLSQNIDSIAISKLLGVAALGMYQVAYQVALLPASQVRPVIHALMLPAYSQLRAISDLRAAIVKIFTGAAAILVPSACFITVFAGPLVRCLLGEQWSAVVPTLRVLSWAAVSLGLTATTIPLFHSMGRPEIPARTTAVRVVLSGAFLYPTTAYLGITGTALAVVAAGFLTLGYELILATRALGMPARVLLHSIRVAGRACVPMLLASVLLPSAQLPGTVVVASIAALLSSAVVLFSLGSTFMPRQARLFSVQGDLPPSEEARTLQ